MPNSESLLQVSLLTPFAAAAGSLFVRDARYRRILVGVMAALLAASTLLLLAQGPFTYNPHDFLGVPLEYLLLPGDVVLIIVFFAYGFYTRNKIILSLAFVQMLLTAYFEFSGGGHIIVEPLFYVDHLSLVMTVVIGTVGSAIAFYALGYMEEHERHQRLKKSLQPRFFAVFLLFLGAMNGLVFANSLPWLFFFWEITTFCSFMMIRHDGTAEACRNAQRALWMNLLGGAAFMVGMIVLSQSQNTLAVSELASKQQGGIVLLALAFLVVAGFTKAAQMPFQGWLLGAMVAPTPVSALLHSSTMVKAGVYLVIRLAPAYEATALSTAVAVAGAFTFVVTAALAIGQRNGKRVLAYSTISNLGLIIACAGLNSPLAISAAILLIVFHAISKALLFLAVGTIEQNIHSRNIEDMDGLINRMPLTTVVTLIGIFTMLLPPFGVLIAKWAAIEAAAKLPLAVLMFAAGSAFTVVFWTKWMGRLLSSEAGQAPRMVEKLTVFVRLPLVGLAGAALLLTALVNPVLDDLIGPAVRDWYPAQGLEQSGLGLAGPTGSFPVWPLLLVLAIILALAARATASRKQQVQPAYMCGEQVAVEGAPTAFRSAMDEKNELSLGSYYFDSILGEGRITKWANPIAVLLLVVILGVAIR